MSSPSLTDAQLTGRNAEHIQWLTPSIGIHQQMLTAWNAMKQAAQHDGIDLRIASGYRDFDRQCRIWNNKFLGKTAIKNINNDIIDTKNLATLDKIKAILLYSALPSASRHHWGTDIDVYAPNLLGPEQTLQLESWEYQSNGPMHKLTLWLEKYSNSFGFFLPYDRYRGGVACEPWHLSYAPLANHYQRQLTPLIIKEALTTNTVMGYQEIISHLSMINESFIQNVGNFNHG
ncbi:M15 family metallopeptidase [Colwelliaceae bacterium 6471]